MPESTDHYQPSRGVLYAFAGVSLFVIGGVFLSNSNEADFFFPVGLGLMGCGFYLLLVGAVARGIQVARR